MNLNSLINKWQRWIAKRRHLVKLAVKCRNQANKIIGYSLATSHEPANNGEELLIQKIAAELETIVDAGANRGDWTKMVRKYTAPATCFHMIEPGIEAYGRLRSFTGINIFAYQLGLSDTNGELDFYEEENAGEQSSFVITNYHNKFSTIKVPVSTLQEFCSNNNINTISLLKIDCEGYDYKVLLGARQLLEEGRIKYIQFEYGSSWRLAGATLKAAIDWLNSFGYKVWLISHRGIVKFDIGYYGEYFEYSNFFAAQDLPKNFGGL